AMPYKTRRVVPTSDRISMAIIGQSKPRRPLAGIPPQPTDERAIERERLREVRHRAYNASHAQQRDRLTLVPRAMPLSRTLPMPPREPRKGTARPKASARGRDGSRLSSSLSGKAPSAASSRTASRPASGAYSSTGRGTASRGAVSRGVRHGRRGEEEEFDLQTLLDTDPARALQLHLSGMTRRVLECTSDMDVGRGDVVCGPLSARLASPDPDPGTSARTMPGDAALPLRAPRTRSSHIAHLPPRDRSARSAAVRAPSPAVPGLVGTHISSPASAGGERGSRDRTGHLWHLHLGRLHAAMLHSQDMALRQDPSPSLASFDCDAGYVGDAPFSAYGPMDTADSCLPALRFVTERLGDVPSLPPDLSLLLVLGLCGLAVQAGGTLRQCSLLLLCRAVSARPSLLTLKGTGLAFRRVYVGAVLPTLQSTSKGQASTSKGSRGGPLGISVSMVEGGVPVPVSARVDSGRGEARAKAGTRPPLTPSQLVRMEVLGLGCALAGAGLVPVSALPLPLPLSLPPPPLAPCHAIHIPPNHQGLVSSLSLSLDVPREALVGVSRRVILTLSLDGQGTRQAVKGRQVRVMVFRGVAGAGQTLSPSPSVTDSDDGMRLSLAEHSDGDTPLDVEASDDTLADMALSHHQTGAAPVVWSHPHPGVEVYGVVDVLEVPIDLYPTQRRVSVMVVAASAPDAPGSSPSAPPLSLGVSLRKWQDTDRQPAPSMTAPQAVTRGRQRVKQRIKRCAVSINDSLFKTQPEEGGKGVVWSAPRWKPHCIALANPTSAQSIRARHKDSMGMYQPMPVGQAMSTPGGMGMGVGVGMGGHMGAGLGTPIQQSDSIPGTQYQGEASLPMGDGVGVVSAPATRQTGRQGSRQGSRGSNHRGPPPTRSCLAPLIDSDDEAEAVSAAQRLDQRERSVQEEREAERQREREREEEEEATARSATAFLTQSRPTSKGKAKGKGRARSSQSRRPKRGSSVGKSRSAKGRSRRSLTSSASASRAQSPDTHTHTQREGVTLPPSAFGDGDPFPANPATQTQAPLATNDDGWGSDSEPDTDLIPPNARTLGDVGMALFEAACDVSCEATSSNSLYYYYV
ncbi:hypothetical protein KIPB_001900, partial [Kipferlia bialata]